jgi:hypothetical protein
VRFPREIAAIFCQIEAEAKMALPLLRCIVTELLA